MTSHPSLYGQPLPGVRELFPDLFYPRPMTNLWAPPQPTTRDPQSTPHDMTNPSYIPTPYPSQLPPLDRSTAQDTAIRTADQRYTRLSLPPTYSRPQSRDHETQWRPSDPVANTSPPHVSPTYPSPEVSSPCPQPRPQQLEHGGANQSTLPYNRQSSSPMTPSPHVASNPAEFPLRPSPFDQKSEETHSGKKRHKCDVCGSYWGRPSSLKIHMVSHTGVKEFVCSICKQDFGVKSNYTRHIRVHHKDSSEGIQTRAAGRRRRGSRRHPDVGPVRFVDEGPKFQGL